MKQVIKYYLSFGNWGDGKSVCLWRSTENSSCKIARFQNIYSAKVFAEEFNFPLSSNIEQLFKHNLESNS